MAAAGCPLRQPRSRQQAATQGHAARHPGAGGGGGAAPAAAPAGGSRSKQEQAWVLGRGLHLKWLAKQRSRHGQSASSSPQLPRAAAPPGLQAPALPFGSSPLAVAGAAPPAPGAWRSCLRAHREAAGWAAAMEGHAGIIAAGTSAARCPAAAQRPAPAEPHLKQKSTSLMVACWPAAPAALAASAASASPAIAALRAAASSWGSAAAAEGGRGGVVGKRCAGCAGLCRRRSKHGTQGGKQLPVRSTLARNASRQHPPSRLRWARPISASAEAVQCCGKWRAKRGTRRAARRRQPSEPAAGEGAAGGGASSRCRRGGSGRRMLDAARICQQARKQGAEAGNKRRRERGGGSPCPACSRRRKEASRGGTALLLPPTPPSSSARCC